MGVAQGLLGMMGLGLLNRELKQRSLSESIGGLMGKPNEPYMLGADQQFNPGEQIPGLEIAGSGLLGSMQPGAMRDQAAFAGGLMQLPGQAQTGANMLNSVFDRDQANQNNVANQFYKQQQQLQKDDFAEMQRMENFGFKDQSQLNSAVNQWQAQHDKQVAPLRESLFKYQNVVKRLNVAGGDLANFNGTDDLMMIRAFIKMMNGGREAFMSDDQQAALMAAQGFGTFDQVLNMLTGMGTLDKSGREKMLDGMNTMALQLQGTLQGERALLQGKMDQFGVPTDLVVRPEMPAIERQSFVSPPQLSRQEKIRARKKQRDQKPLPPPPPGVTFRGDRVSGRVVRDGQ